MPGSAVGSVTMVGMRPTRSDHATLAAADRDRLARRYPAPRLPRPLVIAIVAVVAAGSLTWLIWTALVHAEPVVSAKVAAYTVVSDSRIDATDHHRPARPVDPGGLPRLGPGGGLPAGR